MRIAILAFPRVQLLDVIGPADVFSEAARQLGDPRAYRIQVLGTTPGELRGSSGLRLLPDACAYEFAGRIDTLLVAGSPHAEEVARDARLRQWLQRQSTSVRRIGSVCTGAFVLAAAGLLDGRTVTTHWSAADRLAAAHPEVFVEPDRIFVKDRQVYTSAGVTAGLDLALAMVEEDHGRDLSLKVARELVMFLKRPGGQSQFSTHLAAQAPEQSTIRAVQDYVLANLKSDLSVTALAARARMSERNFARIFKSETGITPAEFVDKTRIEAAMRTIEVVNLPLKRLADRLGYSSADSLRRSFVRRVGVTPAEYRARFS
jgi:transcriptional regulator GlxA family with amidase domain